jgi:uncharacterized membrane protein
MYARRLRRLFHEPFWFALLGAIVVGAIAGKIFTHERGGDEIQSIFGRAWRGDAAETRAVLGGLFGFMTTIVALVLSVNAVVIKSAAYQYSPRLIPLYIKNAPTRRALLPFVVLAAYVLVAVRELGLVAEDGAGPRVVISGAVLLLFVAISFLLVDLVRTFRFIRVERVLDLARDATFAAAERVRTRVDRLALDEVATLSLPDDASALVAAESGYLVDVDVRHLAQVARAAKVRTRICHAIGDYVDKGEVVGWVACDRGGAVGPRLARELAATLMISAVRELEYDPALGIRIIVDVANRALSSSANDPYTARQALNQLRSVLHHLARLPLGDWNVVDRDGSVRVSVMTAHLRELLSVAVGGPLYYGAGHPDVLEGLLEIVRAVLRVARQPKDYAAAGVLLERIERLVEDSDLDPERLERLRAEAEPMPDLRSAREGQKSRR